MKNREAWLLIVLVLVLRGAVLWIGYDDLRGDPDGYRHLARNIIDHDTLGFGERPSAFRPPLYPIMLVPCIALAGTDPLGIAILHGVLGGATVWLTWLIGRRWGMGRFAVLAALFVAVDPILLRQSTLVMTETLATFAITLAVFILTTTRQEDFSVGRLLAGGCVLGMAALVRPTFLAWAALGVGALLLSAFGRRERFREAAFVTLGLSITLAPWIVRNDRSLGHPIVATTHGGYTLLLANNPSFYAYLREAPPGAVWDATRFNAEQAARLPQHTPEEEAASNRHAYRLTWQNIRREPVMFARSCLVRLARLWGVLPHQTSTPESLSHRIGRYGIGLWYTLISMLAIVGMATWGRRLVTMPWAWVTILVVSLSLVHACYWSNLRMRAPLVPIVALWSVAGLDCTVHRQSRCKSFGEKELHE